MIFRHEHRDGVWLDLEQPTPEEIRSIAREFSVGERIESELLSPTPSPLVAGDGNVALSVLHFPAQSEAQGTIKNQEVDFIVGRKFVITVRYEVIAPLHALRKILEAEELVSGRMPIGSDTLLEILFAHLYEAVRDHTSHLADQLGRIEHDMFSGHERSSVRAISDVSREFLHLDASIRGQEDPLQRFFHTLAERNFFGPSFSERAGRILADRLQVTHVIQTHRAMATELRETNASLLEARQNEVMKTLTVANFIFLPLELTAFVFGMHALGTPLENNPNAFWIIMAVMLGIIGIMTVYFARKRWIF